VFGSVIAVVFQKTFYSENHQKYIFLIFKKLFLISAHQNDQKTPKNINIKQKLINKIKIFSKIFLNT
jgi:hypothetical protein